MQKFERAHFEVRKNMMNLNITGSLCFELF